MGKKTWFTRNNFDSMEPYGKPSFYTISLKCFVTSVPVQSIVFHILQTGPVFISKISNTSCKYTKKDMVETAWLVSIRQRLQKSILFFTHCTHEDLPLNERHRGKMATLPDEQLKRVMDYCYNSLKKEMEEKSRTDTVFNTIFRRADENR